VPRTSGGNPGTYTGPVPANGGIDTGGTQSSGALTTYQLVSGTAHQFSGTRDYNVHTPVTFTPTAGAAATCAVAISPDGVTYSTICTWSVPLGTALDSFTLDVDCDLPGGWNLRMTVVNATLGVSTIW
jgi:hypothetical protein